ncbi:Cloroperoxidase [Aureobasidium pullulans]|uniref:Cloroperoxidase n=1 Tax=Aureobasidium pullulans TaxID=5580 RepID=A0A4S8VTV4_AURPU|nr:Cloroperoxidase [Aureobasidium pullulans]
MKLTAVFFLSLITESVSFPWLHRDFAENAKRGLDIVKKDPELVSLLESIYQDQLQERDDFFAAMADYTGSCGDTEAEFEPILEKRTTANCLPHTLPDFLPSNITGLKKFPEAAYPYKDPAPSDQRGPCPGMITLANHGYIPRNGITTVAQTVVAAARVFNMGADLTTFLAEGSVLFAGDIPTMRYSIGGADKRTNSAGALGSALGTETGLSVSYQPEQIPPQGWYRRGFPMFLSEGIDGIITLYTGVAAILGQPDLFGANTGTAGDFNGQQSLASFAGSGNYGGTTVNGTICALEGALYGDFVNEFSNVLSTAVGALNTVTSLFGQYGCPVPSGAPAAQGATTFPGYPKPSPCTLNRMQNGLDQCAPDTNTYDRFNSKSVPFCLNSPSKVAASSNPLPVPGIF